MVVGVIASFVGSTLSSTYKLYAAGETKQQAVALAVESLEQLSTSPDENFECSCDSGGDCNSTPGTCIIIISGSSWSCIPRTGFNSCWTTLPIGLTTSTKLHLNPQGGDWMLAEESEEINISGIEFTRNIAFEDLKRNSSGEIDPSGNLDTGSKEVTVTITWQEHGRDKELQMSQIINHWKSN